ncbi:MAG TPA: hypothetical protein VH415_09870 [Nitrososphaeraceae archaeon]
MYNTKSERSNKEWVFVTTSWVRKGLILGLLASISTAICIITISPANMRGFSVVIAQTLASANAAAFSLIIVQRQKTNGLVGKAFALLALGFTLYLIAEILHGYDAMSLDNDNVFFSIPYALWLLGYGPFFFFIFSMYNLLGASHIRRQKVLVGFIAAVFFVCIISLTFRTTDLSTQKTASAFLIPSIFLGLDLGLIVPSTLIILSPVKGPLTPIPWIFSAIILLTIGDTLLLCAITIPSAQYLTLVPNLFFISSYLVATAGLFWYNKFFIFDGKSKRYSIQ